MTKINTPNGIIFKEGETTELILKAFFKVYNELGSGFLEKVYENSMRIELESMGLKVESQRLVSVFYQKEEVGSYYVDLLINN